MTGATSEAEMVYPSGTPKYTPVFSEDCITSVLVFLFRRLMGHDM